MTRHVQQGVAVVVAILVVALARKLVVALWRYLSTGVIPEGVELRAWDHLLPRGH